jgi:phosphoribosyl-AMP cyclohydrolase
MKLNYKKLDGILPAVIQNARTGRVLMVGFMNDEAFRRTVESGRVVFYSRTRRRLWTKGETSGHFLTVREISADCDEDSLLVQVDPVGPGVCHEGYESCFHWQLKGSDWVQSEGPVFDPKSVYGSVK